ncbi:MAG: nitroreductase family protein [Fretibacterium sp.]|uniref:nitroreductase family protein n=1 Tax=Fretibacterium sp. OH1220_COT-178 TaxID=2491047 RepID=UPI000F601984|nr:nitroreductase family protein [Fretibacterium sp. OH1220_COT-178]MDO4787512.1 nitroreductase family protein [Fretibacterium sp.]RRD65388.1 4Fe-4S dicluster domain-containing protein [Fretibacterium sp. OH1220_COT-178]
MSFYTVGEACTSCGLCVELCPARIITADSEGRPFVEEGREALCIRCGQCVSFCPVSCNALAFQEGPPLAVLPELFPTPEAAETLLRSRRSVRRFRREGVPRAVLERLFETVRYAPTAQNLQKVRWIVLETRERVERLEREVVGFFRAAAEAPDVPSGRAQLLRAIVRRSDAGVPIILRGAPQVAVAVVPKGDGFTPEDGAIALTYLELAAHALGIGCCWGGFLTRACRASEALRRSLGVAEDELVAGAQMLGYSAQGRSRRLPPRKAVAITWMN